MVWYIETMKIVALIVLARILSDFKWERIDNEFVAYSEWTTTERTSMVKTEQHFSDYIVKVLELFKSLCCHHFIAIKQSQRVKTIKDNLIESDCLITMDFAENYSFLVRDAVQGFHWNNSQATLHNFVIYSKSCDGILHHENYCSITNDLTHDASSVYTFLQKLIPLLKARKTLLNKMFVFSDGGLPHYKNRYNFANLSLFKYDHDLECESHFWASCHGVCDGIGDTGKRSAREAAKQRCMTDLILNGEQLFKWAVDAIKGIKCIFLHLV